MRRGFPNAANLGRRLLLCTLALPCAPSGADGGDAPAPSRPAPLQLSPLTVHGQHNLLDQADQRLKALQQSLPGADAPSGSGFLDWYLAHDDPNQLGEAGKSRLLDLLGKNQEDKPAPLRRQQP